MRLKPLFKKIGKHILMGLLGGLAGIVLSLLYFFAIWLPINAEKIGLGIIVLFPVMFILFSILGFIPGFILGLIIYPIVKYFKK